MPEHIRSFLFLLVLATIAFFFAKKVTASVLERSQFNRWRNTWFGLTSIAFLSGNFWVYIILSIILLTIVYNKEDNPFALFFVLLFALPRVSGNIPGFGVVNFLFSIDYVIVLSLVVLLPSYISLRKDPDTPPFLKFWVDRILLVYMVIGVIAFLRDTSLTDGMRKIIYSFTTIFLPYYVASRGIKNLQQFKQVIAAFVIAAMVAATTAIFEYIRFWLLYSALGNSLGVTWDMGSYLGRGDSLRALGTLGQPIAMGYVMCIALALYIYHSHSIKDKVWKIAGLGILMGGIYAPLSRGPWIGAIIMLILYIIISPKAIKRLTKLTVAAIIILPLIATMPIGKKVIDMLPFVGKTDTENVEYRIRLLDAAYTVFNRYPFFGSVKYRDELGELGMVQGEGIVDVVNSYLDVVLEFGIVGLILFLGFFTIVILTIIQSLQKLEDKKGDAHLLGRVLVVNQIAILITITSVSSILVIPVVYWAIAGLSLSYERIAKGVKSTRVDINILPTVRLAGNNNANI